MNISGESKVIASAYIKARTEMSATVTKDAKGNYGKYATLAAIVEATSAVLAKYGLAVLQEASAGESGVCVDTWLIHESGATMQFAPLTMPLSNRTPQAVGSAITYARRYQLAAVCGLAPDDDDGQTAQDAAERKVAQTVSSAGLDGDAQFFKFEKPHISGEQAIELAKLGKVFYGDEWGEQEVKLSMAVSKGVADEIARLTAKEAAVLIDGIKRKQYELTQAAQQPAQVA